MNGFYSKIPAPIKSVGGSFIGTIPRSWRYGKLFRKTRSFLEESQWWSKDKIEEYQLEQLSKLLNHSYNNVSYYKRIFDEHGFKPKDFQDFNDLKQLPYLTKQDIQENLDDLKARNFPKNKFKYATTGGSTGTPMGFYWEAGVADPIEKAFTWRYYNWANIDYTDKRVVLRGASFSKKDKSGDTIYFQKNNFDKELILSSYHMANERLKEYIIMIEKYKPTVIQGYPSSLDILSSYLHRNNRQLNGIKSVITASETLYPAQREKMEKSFGSAVFDHYGNTERCVLAHQCEQSDLYHIIPEYGFIEIVGKDGRDIKKEGGNGEIIATGFNNYAFPFIRYKTQDLGVWTNKKCNCGREHKLLKRIDGRLQEFVITKDNTKIALVSLIFAQHFDAFSRIKIMQIVQEKKGKIALKIVKLENYSENDENELYKKIKKCSNNELNIEFGYVNDIPRTVRGKHRFLIQKLDVEFGE